MPLHVDVCVIIFAECPSLPNLENGDIVTTNRNLYGSVATFSCHTDLLLVGNSIITCLEDKRWNGTMPSCNPKGIQCTLHPKSTVTAKFRFLSITLWLALENVSYYYGIKITMWSVRLARRKYLWLLIVILLLDHICMYIIVNLPLQWICTHMGRRKEIKRCLGPTMFVARRSTYHLESPYMETWRK